MTDGSHGLSSTTTAQALRFTCCDMWHGVTMPPACPLHGSLHYVPYQPPTPTFTTGTFTWSGPPRLSDDDVKRIADEVVRRLREDK